jgi:hypothetical protein
MKQLSRWQIWITTLIIWSCLGLIAIGYAMLTCTHITLICVEITDRIVLLGVIVCGVGSLSNLNR